MNLTKNLKLGAFNLLINCAELSAKHKILIVAEDEKLGWYDEFIALVIKECCDELSIKSEILNVGEPSDEIYSRIKKISKNYDCIIYFSRIGDLQRFENVHSCKVIMSYARNIAMLASNFGTTDYQIHIDFKKSIDEVFSNSEYLKIICPKGTNLSGQCSKVFTDNDDVAIKRFPMVIHSPVSASKFKGHILIDKYLTSSGSRFFSPSNISLDEIVKFNIEQGLIKSIIGNKKDIKNVKNHFTYISNKFKIDKDIVHSWHTGIHSGLLTNTVKTKDADCWSNTVFGNPKYLHFHTCGNYAPGEISLMLENPTILVDDVPLWESGKINFKNFTPVNECTDKWPLLLSL